MLEFIMEIFKSIISAHYKTDLLFLLNLITLKLTMPQTSNQALKLFFLKGHYAGNLCSIKVIGIIRIICITSVFFFFLFRIYSSLVIYLCVCVGFCKPLTLNHNCLVLCYEELRIDLL